MMMTWYPRVLVLWLMWLPVLAWGQEVPSEPRAETTGTYSTASHLILGSVLGAVGNLGGWKLGQTGANALGPECSDFTCRDRLKLSIFTGLGSTVGTALPIYLLGTLFDGQGSFGYTLLGASLGAIPSAFLAYGSVAGLEVAAGICYLVTPIVGALLGYSLSERSVAARPPAKLGARVTPVLRMTREGRVVGGLVGQF
ncbi:hypothetical protein D7X12_16445 [Corallococcus sicarius]|uniref:Uncharacterized protein n=2 Tax=Corallococcus sicarius TaxID=2316726 RepID=A0A3A8NDW5_9BACT|nr:hypothetical protein D7X12_16445 [Corallococcus sicarius]